MTLNKDSIVKKPNSTTKQLKSWVWHGNGFSCPPLPTHPPPPQTQCHQYLSCFCPNFNQTLKVGSKTTLITTTWPTTTIKTITTTTKPTIHLLLTQFWPNFNGRFLEENNNISIDNTINNNNNKQKQQQQQIYLSYYWPNSDKTLNNNNRNYNNNYKSKNNNNKS